MRKLAMLLLSVCLLFGVGLTGCGDKYSYDGESRYTVHNAKSEIVLESDNVFTAIIKAGTSSKSSDRHFVYDHIDKKTVYSYDNEKYYMFRGEEFQGETKKKTDAESFAAQYPDSYVINGLKYAALGESVSEGSITDFVRGREPASGSYLYMFSKKYNESGMEDLGYAYFKFTLRFSEAEMTYHTEGTEKGWNAYIFVNSMMDSPWSNCDMGLINGWENYKGQWFPFFNFNGTMITPPGDPVTVMKHNAETDTYYGADDLEFETYATKSEYVMKIKNLTTGKVSTYTQPYANLKDNVQKSYMLLSASYCPVLINGEIWNPRSGASFTNIIFENVKIAKYSGSYASAALEDYMPGAPSMSYCFAYAADNCAYSYGTHAADGTYKNGAAYKAGDKYIITDISYRSK